MLPSFANVGQYLFGALAGCGCAYYALCIASARAFRGECARSTLLHAEQQRFAPPVSILKPLRGTDRHMYECFRSHCLQNYPEYEIVFGVSEADDPAIELVERLREEFPERKIALVVCAKKLGANIKVSNLAQMLQYARYEYVVVNDSDILVDREYLHKVVAPFANAGTGMVTTLYRGASGTSLGSKLEALGIETDFASGVLVARFLEGGVHFGLGSTLAMSRESLDAIGGFWPLLDFLADDYELGKRISDAGYKVVLSEEVVETFLPDYSFGSYWEHQLRWMRSIRGSRGAGYAGLLFTFGVPFAIATVCATAGAMWSLALLALVLLLRGIAAHEVAVRVLHDRGVARHFWLIPLRDTCALLVWAAAYSSSTVVWRGDRFTLKEGKLRHLA